MKTEFPHVNPAKIQFANLSDTPQFQTLDELVTHIIKVWAGIPPSTKELRTTPDGLRQQFTPVPGKSFILINWSEPRDQHGHINLQGFDSGARHRGIDLSGLDIKQAQIETHRQQLAACCQFGQPPTRTLNHE